MSEYRHRPESNRKSRELDARRKRAFFNKRRAEFFASRGDACENCGGRDRLEAHHVDPTTKSTSGWWVQERARFEIEAAKCIALCHDCHLAVTAKQRQEKASANN